MNSKKCEEQLKSLIEAWDLKEATLNQTDIEAIKHLLSENEQLKEDIKTLWIALWNNDTEMTSKQSEIFDKYYDEFHKV